MNWEEFDKNVDVEGLANEVKEAAKNGGKSNYKDVPHGEYEVKIAKLGLGVSKKGDPMFICWMKILDGSYKNSIIFMNQVLTQGFQIHIVNEFLESLVGEEKDAPTVEFKTYKQYNSLILDVEEAIENKYEYRLNYGANNKGYDTFKIDEVYVLE